jgi:hypothetical protein
MMLSKLIKKPVLRKSKNGDKRFLPSVKKPCFAQGFFFAAMVSLHKINAWYKTFVDDNN